MTAFAITATLFCIWGCATLVLMERQLADPATWSHPASRELERTRRAAKILASTAFVLLAESALFRDAFSTFMFFGLVFGALGDVFLLGRGTRAFMLGLVAFLIGHVAYVVGVAHVVPPAQWLAEAGVLVVPPIIIAGLALKMLWPRLGGLAVPVVVYVLAIVAMMIGALAARDVLPHPRGTLLAIGAALFFASDLAVARDRFIQRDFTNKLYGLPAYYAGQLLIAWAIR
jgi:uncharacterized membrane protein YhhN